MSASAAVALRPYNEAPRAVLADRRGTTNFINSISAEIHSLLPEASQPGQPGRIIAIHWLRPDDGEMADD